MKKKIKTDGKDTCGWVLWNGKVKFVGFSVVYKDEGKDQISAVYVLPEYQCKGIGKILLKKALEFFKDSKEIWLEVAIFNKNAIHFY